MASGDNDLDPAANVEVLSRFWGPQPIVQIEVYRTANLYSDWEARSDTFYIHKEFLTSYSYLFRLAYDEALKTTTAPRLRIEFPSPASLGHYVEWAYTQKLNMTIGGCKHADLIWVWLFAERIGAIGLQNYAIIFLDQFRMIGRVELIKPDLVAFIYKETGSESPLKKFILSTWDDKIQTREASEYPPMLLADLFNSRKGQYVPYDPKMKIQIQEYFVDSKYIVERFSQPKPIARPEERAVNVEDTEGAQRQQGAQNGEGIPFEISERIKREELEMDEFPEPVAKKRKGIVHEQL